MSVTLNNKEIKELLVLLNVFDYDINYNLSKLWTKIVKKMEKALKPIKISSGKAKARNLQKWVCERIGKLVGVEYNQQDDQCLIHSREMGQSGVDVILRGKAKELFPYSIECKSSEKLSINKAIIQAKRNQQEGTVWIVVYKNKSLKNPVVIMDWNDFEIMQKAVINHIEGEIENGQNTKDTS